MYHKLKKCLNSKSSHQRCSIEKAVLKNFTIFTWKHLRWSLFFIELQASRPATVLRETPTKVFSREYCENFKNTYFQENPQTTVSLVLVLLIFFLIFSSALNSISLFSSGFFLRFKVVTRCNTCCHSLSLVFTRCTTLVCHFINDPGHVWLIFPRA